MYSNVTTRQWFDMELKIIKMGFRDARVVPVLIGSSWEINACVVRKIGQVSGQDLSYADDISMMIFNNYSSVLPNSPNIAVEFRNKCLVD